MKKILIILALFAYSIIGVFACSCSPIKGLNGKHPGIATADSIWQNTLLIEVVSTSDSGIIVNVLKDYYNKVEFQTLFIQNGNPGVYCIHSTDQFEKGEIYLICPYSFDEETKSTSLPTCWESFVNVGQEIINAQIIDVHNGETSIWTTEQIEKKLSIQIQKNYR